MDKKFKKAPNFTKEELKKIAPALIGLTVAYYFFSSDDDLNPTVATATTKVYLPGYPHPIPALVIVDRKAAEHVNFDQNVSMPGQLVALLPNSVSTPEFDLHYEKSEPESPTGFDPGAREEMQRLAKAVTYFYEKLTSRGEKMLSNLDLLIEQLEKMVGDEDEDEGKVFVRPGVTDIKH